eukprot:3469909-Prymnesium_polylepis.1
MAGCARTRSEELAYWRSQWGTSAESGRHRELDPAAAAHHELIGSSGSCGTARPSRSCFGRQPHPMRLRRSIASLRR